MKYRVRVEVSLKPGHSDPEGEMTAKSLKELRYPVENVKVSKLYEIDLYAKSLKETKKYIDEMSRKLLANPTKDDYRFVIEEIE